MKTNDNEIVRFPQNIPELEAFIEKYQNKLVQHAYFKLGNKEEAEDVVQEVFVKIYLEKNKFEKVNNSLSFIYKMISNACIDKLRLSQRQIIKSIDDSKEAMRLHETDCSASLIEREEYERINKLLSTLPAEQAEVLQFRIIDELSFVEISDILELPVTTVKSRFKYGLDKLKIYYQNLKEVKNEL